MWPVSFIKDDCINRLFLFILQPVNRTEFYVELIDDDRDQFGEENNELIDRFAITITGNITKKKISGIYNLAKLELSFSIQCSDNFFGESCLFNSPNLFSSSANEEVTGNV